MRAFCIGLASVAVLSAPAFAQDEVEEAPCMAPIAITSAIVEEAGHYQFSGAAGSGAAPTFLIGHLSPTRDAEDAGEVFGAVIFVRNTDGGWRAFMPRRGEDVEGVYVAPNGAMMVATMWAVEGPGQSWTLFRSPDGFATGVCGRVHFPDTLNQPTWNNEALDLTDFDINARGRGELIGVGRTDAHGDLWYVYRTRDGGATWSAPRRISREREARAGLYTPIVHEDAAPEALVAELTAYAAGR